MLYGWRCCYITVKYTIPEFIFYTTQHFFFCFIGMSANSLVPQTPLKENLYLLRWKQTPVRNGIHSCWLLSFRVKSKDSRAAYNSSELNFSEVQLYKTYYFCSFFSWSFGGDWYVFSWFGFCNSYWVLYLSNVRRLLVIIWFVNCWLLPNH